MEINSFRKNIQKLQEGSPDFEALALELFSFQSTQNPVYAEYMERIGLREFTPCSLQEIPFLPIGFFKTREVFCEGFIPEIRFRSSGTGGNRSQHILADAAFYGSQSRKGFISAIGSIEKYEILALLPGYEENPESSLIYMVQALKEAKPAGLRFFGMDFSAFVSELEACRQRGHKPLIFGVSHALLSMLESRLQFDFSNAVLVETGGMKGLRKEISKAELLEILEQGFRPKKLVSEFGMCELMSQAYAFPERYHPVSALRAFVRQPEDPLAAVRLSGRGVLNFIDLGNFASCAFIASEDLGEVYADGTFSVHGRLDQAEIRGCNLLFA